MIIQCGGLTSVLVYWISHWIGGRTVKIMSLRRLYLGFPMIHFILNFPMEIYILRRSLTGENTEKKTVGLSCL